METNKEFLKANPHYFGIFFALIGGAGLLAATNSNGYMNTTARIRIKSGIHTVEAILPKMKTTHYAVPQQAKTMPHPKQAVNTGRKTGKIFYGTLPTCIIHPHKILQCGENVLEASHKILRALPKRPDIPHNFLRGTSKALNVRRKFLWPASKASGYAP